MGLRRQAGHSGWGSQGGAGLRVQGRPPGQARADAAGHKPAPPPRQTAQQGSGDLAPGGGGPSPLPISRPEGLSPPTTAPVPGSETPCPSVSHAALAPRNGGAGRVPRRPGLSAVWPTSGACLSGGPSPPGGPAGEPTAVHAPGQLGICRWSPGDSDGPGPPSPGLSLMCPKSGPWRG